MRTLPLYRCNVAGDIQMDLSDKRERQLEREFSREVKPQPCEFASNSGPVMGLWISQFSANRQIMKRN